RPERLVGVNIDITERKQAEQALTERNTQLALAGRAALVGSYVYDVKTGVTQISQGYATIHGLPEENTETTINAWRARVHPEDLARAEGLREQAFADRRKEDNAEYRIVLSTGEVRWIERRGSISYDENGRPERVVGVNIDVTERKRAEQALVERNILLALLAGPLALAIFLMIPTPKSCRFQRTTLRFMAFLRGLSRSLAAIAWPASIPRTWSEWGLPAGKPSASGGANIAQNIVSFVLAARFDGSRYVASLHMTPTDIPSGQLASASMSLTANSPSCGSPSAMHSSGSPTTSPRSAALPMTILG